jgi:hypothetical protein
MLDLGKSKKKGQLSFEPRIFAAENTLNFTQMKNIKYLKSKNKKKKLPAQLIHV